MFNKSGQSTLDTLKEILSDVKLHCHVKERKNLMNPGYTMLASIRDTMSDRASTERHYTTFSRSTDQLFYPMSYITGLTLMKQKRNYAPN